MPPERPPVNPTNPDDPDRVRWTAERVRLHGWFQDTAGHLAPIHSAELRIGHWIRRSSARVHSCDPRDT